MHQLPAEVWNKIAASQALQLQASEQLMAMDQPQLDAALEQQAQALREDGKPEAVISAYQALMMPLAEQEAISRYINQTDSLALRQALPDVASAEEALQLAANDYPLTPDDLQILYPLLQALQPSA